MDLARTWRMSPVAGIASAAARATPLAAALVAVVAHAGGCSSAKVVTAQASISAILLAEPQTTCSDYEVDQPFTPTLGDGGVATPNLVSNGSSVTTAGGSSEQVSIYCEVVANNGGTVTYDLSASLNGGWSLHIAGSGAAAGTTTTATATFSYDPKDPGSPIDYVGTNDCTLTTTQVVKGGIAGTVNCPQLAGQNELISGTNNPVVCSGDANIAFIGCSED